MNSVCASTVGTFGIGVCGATLSSCSVPCRWSFPVTARTERTNPKRTLSRKAGRGTADSVIEHVVVSFALSVHKPDRWPWPGLRRRTTSQVDRCQDLMQEGGCLGPDRPAEFVRKIPGIGINCSCQHLAF